MELRAYNPQVRLLTTGLGLLLLLAAVACDPGPDGPSVTGSIVDVVPESIDKFESLTIRDDSGDLWTFGPARVPHFTPSHLIQHQANGDRITVYYRVEEDGSRTVVDITDA